jgi:hypothetical protein
MWVVGVAEARGRRLGRVREGTVGLVLGFVGLLLVLAGLALPEGGTSTAIHVVAIGIIVGALVFLARDYARRERGGRQR